MNRNAPPDRRLTAAEQALVAAPESLALAERVARGFACRIPRLADEVRSAAFVGLCQAAVRYRPDLGPFDQFAWARVRGAVRDELRRHGAHGFTQVGRSRLAAGGPAVLSLSRRERPGAATNVTEVASGDAPVGAALETEDELRALTSGLPESQGGPIVALFLYGLTQAAIARGRGVHEGTVSRAIAAGLAALKRGAAA